MKNTRSSVEALEGLWPLLQSGNVDGAAALTVGDGFTWDDPIYNGHSGEAARTTAIRQLSDWYRKKTLGESLAIDHLRTTSDDRRVVVESVLGLRDGVIWSQAEQCAIPAERIQLPVAVVGDRSTASPLKYSAIRVYFGTWAVLSGSPQARLGPIAPDERKEARAALEAMPVLRRYFECLAEGNAEIIDLFEPDGYFREPANNFACGYDQLKAHFSHILELGGVGVEFLTATRGGETLALELQTIQWGTKKMAEPQAGFAAYDLGPHGRLIGSRVYDSVVPPPF
jgi:hypothetical protein